jgi:hypothetical protein
MSNNPILPVIPGDDETARAAAVGEPPTTEVDGDRKLDPDANDDLIDSADADRVATGADESTSS